MLRTPLAVALVLVVAAWASAQDATGLSQMQTRRLFEESGAPDIRFFTDEASARAWLTVG